MNRALQILMELQDRRQVSADRLAETLGVTRRTLGADVAALNEALEPAASVTLAEGSYRLLVTDPLAYGELRRSIAEANSLNDPETRASFLVGRLFRAVIPVRTEDLAQAMNVGRTTAVADLARARELLVGSEVTIEGRTNVGLSLQGPELAQRLQVLRHHYELAYEGDPLTAQTMRIVRDVLDRNGVDPIRAQEVLRWAVVAGDRVRMGKSLTELPERYEGLVATAAHELAAALARGLENLVPGVFTPAEVMFLAIPFAGMRGSAHAGPTAPAETEAGSGSLVQHVLNVVREEMDIDLADTGYLAEFARHVALMLDRMKYRIWVDDSGVSNLKHDFPVAHRMATLAAKVLEDRVGLPVDESETGFLTAYFQVFLEDRDQRSNQRLRVAVVSGAGRMSAELARVQLAKLLPPSTQYLLLDRAQVADQGPGEVDLVVVTDGEPLECPLPVLSFTHVLDRAELERELKRVQLKLPVGSRRGSSVLANALDEDHFFALPEGTDYADAVEYMTRQLEARGFVEPGFSDRLLRREAEGRMELDPSLGFPHATLEHDRDVMLAVGVVPRDGEEGGVRLIVLLGVPADATHSEDVLLAVYDEVLRLGTRPDLLDELSRAKTFDRFHYQLESSTERQR